MNVIRTPNIGIPRRALSRSALLSVSLCLAGAAALSSQLPVAAQTVNAGHAVLRMHGAVHSTWNSLAANPDLTRRTPGVTTSVPLSDVPVGLAKAVRQALSGQSINGTAQAAVQAVPAGVSTDPYSFLSELTASDGTSDSLFGDSVALSADGSTALVGALAHTVNGNRFAGAAYIFSRSGASYTQTAELTAPNGTYGWFGTSVALSADGSIALVGAAQELADGKFEGAAYVFTRNSLGYTQTAELTASDGANGDSFGDSVALSTDGSIALVGAPGHPVNGIQDAGVAYVFSRFGSSYTQTAELTASDGAEIDQFGYSVALS